MTLALNLYGNSKIILSIVMEYADGGDLLQKIFQYKKKAQQFEENYIWNIFSQVALGLEKLHELGILHRDIKVKLRPKIRVQTYLSQKMESQNQEI